MALTDRELAERHRYVTKHGRKPAPGVTSVDILSKPALHWASSRVAAEASVLLAHDRDLIVAEYREELAGKPINRLGTGSDAAKVSAAKATDDEVWCEFLRTRFDVIWRAKADKGSRVHEHALAWARGDDVDALEDEQPYLDALERFFEDYAPDFLAAESIVLSPNPRGDARLEYGGRLDFIAKVDGPHYRGVFLGDYKTGGQYTEPVALQAAGLMAAEGFALYSPMGAVLDNLPPLPELDGALTVYLREDGTYETSNPFRYTSQQDAEDAFFHLRAALNWRRAIESAERSHK